MTESTKPAPRTPAFARRSRAVAFGAGLLLAVTAPSLYAQMRVAVVDIQRAIMESDQGRRAKTQLRSLFQRRQEQLDGRQQALRRMRDDIERNRATMDRAVLAQRLDEYQREFVAMQQSYMEFQQELAQREAELTKQIYTNMQGVVRQFGEREGYTAIFEQGGVIWSPQQYDVTDRAVEAFNRQYPPGPESAASAAPAASDAGAAPAAGDASATPAASGDGGARTTRPIANPHPRGENQPPAEQ